MFGGPATRRHLATGKGHYRDGHRLAAACDGLSADDRSLSSKAEPGYRRVFRCVFFRVASLVPLTRHKGKSARCVSCAFCQRAYVRARARACVCVCVCVKYTRQARVNKKYTNSRVVKKNVIGWLLMIKVELICYSISKTKKRKKIRGEV